MNFNKEIFFNYLKEEKKVNNNSRYLYRLYKNYDIVKSILDKYPKSGEDILRKYEDSIYTIDNKVLSDKKRINNEIQNISEKIVQNSINDKTIYEDLVNLVNELQEFDENDNIINFYAKKQLTLLQSKLGLPITFFLAAHDVFLEQYRRIYMSQNLDTDFITNKHNLKNDNKRYL